MKAEKICRNIYWVGAIDWKLREFHGYATHKGSTYNAYLVIDDKITLIDTVKGNLKQEMLQRIASVIDPSKIDYVISNHAEPDHSGSISDVVALAKDAVVITSATGGEKGLKGYFGELPYRTVKTGDTLCTGKYNFTFTATPMVHWPDNMVTYLAEEKILFSNDAFGQHYGCAERYDDLADPCDVFFEAKKYYANIVQPFASQVTAALKALESLDIALIAPSHGVMWRKHIAKIVGLYRDWAQLKTDESAVIVYDTMYGSTEMMAQAVHDAFAARGIPAKLMELNTNDLSDIITELLTAKYLAVGCPTINNNILPTVSAFLTYFKSLNSFPRRTFAFGSYGWSGQSVGIVEEVLASSKCTPLLAGQKLLFVPSRQQLESVTSAVLDALSSNT